MFTDVKNAVHSTFVNTYSRFINPDGTSKFLEEGTLTPEEVGCLWDLFLLFLIFFVSLLLLGIC